VVKNRVLFIGDSHTMGYKSVLGKSGVGSFSQWNENNYAHIYGELENRPTVIYAMSGATNRLYTDWLKSMFETYDDISDVFICLAAFNRFTIAIDDLRDEDCIPVDHFRYKMEDDTEMLHRYFDSVIKDNRMQLMNKSTFKDYDNFPGAEFSEEHGLVKPDLRKNTFMQVKLFFELNTFIEKRDFLNSVYSWDNICADNGANLHLFNFTERLRFPKKFDYYGKLKATKIAPKTVEKYFTERYVNHENYLIEDKEHYNYDYHDKVAKEFIPWLMQQPKF
jgi:hypothetical protein